MARTDVPKGPTRQNTWGIVVHFEGNSIGFFDKKSGGAIDSDDTKYYPGGMAPPISLGGRKTTDNVTLQRIYDRFDDHGTATADSLFSKLVEGVGHGVVTITQRPYDFDGNGYGKSITYDGILKRVLPPETDSESGSAAMLEIEVTVNGIPHMT